MQIIFIFSDDIFKIRKMFDSSVKMNQFDQNWIFLVFCFLSGGIILATVFCAASANCAIEMVRKFISLELWNVEFIRKQIIAIFPLVNLKSDETSKI